MKFIEFKTALKDFTIFSTKDIQRIDEGFHRRRLNDWQDKGYIKKVIRNYYIFSDLELNDYALYEIANKIYSPSYISFEMALSYHRVIPESVYQITSATTRKTYSFKTQIGNFSYRTLKPELYFGYELINNNGKYFSIASIEKAIIDYLYINPEIKKMSDFESLRLNSQIFLENYNKRKLFNFANKFSSESLIKKVNDLVRFLEND